MVLAKSCKQNSLKSLIYGNNLLIFMHSAKTSILTKALVIYVHFDSTCERITA